MWKFFQSMQMHWKYSRILRKVYKNENFIENLSKLFGVQFKRDWVGRIYAVINPYVRDGQYDPNAVIFEYDQKGLNDTLNIEKKVMELMLVASQFIQSNNLFDMLTYEIKKIDDMGNYLFIIKSITYDDFIKNIKKSFIFISILIIILTSLKIFL